MESKTQLTDGCRFSVEVTVDDSSRDPEPLKPKKPRLAWLIVDFTCLLAVGLVCLLFKLVAVPYHRGFYCDDDSINKPYKESTVPSSVLYSVGFALAYLVICVTELCSQRRQKRSQHIEYVPFKWLKLKPHHIHVINLLVSFAFGGLVTIFVTDIGKYTVGRLRPHFLSICRAPSSVFLNCSHTYITEDVCTGDPGLLREGRLSFPSGHASFSAYAMTFIIIYMEVMVSFPHSRFLKFSLQLLIAQLGVLCGLSRISDYKHHWSDVLTGLLLGALIAVLITDRVLGMFKRVMTSKHDSKG